MTHSKLDISREEITDHILQILCSLTKDIDIDPITTETALGGTTLDSLCVAYMIGEIQQYYGLRDALFKLLVTADLPILSIRISQLIELVCQCVAQRSTVDTRPVK